MAKPSKNFGDRSNERISRAVRRVERMPIETSEERGNGKRQEIERWTVKITAVRTGHEKYLAELWSRPKRTANTTADLIAADLGQNYPMEHCEVLVENRHEAGSTTSYVIPIGTILAGDFIRFEPAATEGAPALMVIGVDYTPRIEAGTVISISACAMKMTVHPVGDADSESRLTIASAYRGGEQPVSKRINSRVGETIAFVRANLPGGIGGLQQAPDINGVDVIWDTQATGSLQTIWNIAQVKIYNKWTVDGTVRDDFDLNTDGGSTIDKVCTVDPYQLNFTWRGVDVDYYIPGTGLSGIVGGIRKFVFYSDYSTGDDPTADADVVFTVDTSAAKTATIRGVAKVQYEEKDIIIPSSLTGVINEDCTVTISYETETVRVLKGPA